MANPEKSSGAPAAKPAEVPVPPVRTELADLSLERLAAEVKGSPEKIMQYVQAIKPVDYTESPEKQNDSIALLQAHMMIVLAFVSQRMPQEQFAKLSAPEFLDLVQKQGITLLPIAPVGGTFVQDGITSIQKLAANQSTPVGQAVLAKWTMIHDRAKGMFPASTQVQTAPAAQAQAVQNLASTLPPPGSMPQSTEGGLWQDTKNFVSENKKTLAITGAIGIAVYAAFRLFGGEGSKDESKWFSGFTDWKVLTLAGIATAIGLYKFGPDWIKESFEKFKSFFTSDKPSKLEDTKIKTLAEKIVEFNNKENSSRRSAFPEKLIKSKGGMTVAEFTDKDGFFSNAMYTLDSGLSWVTGTSGALSADTKKDWNDYQLLLEYTKKKVKEHRIEYKEDDTMDTVWTKILDMENAPTPAAK